MENETAITTEDLSKLLRCNQTDLPDGFKKKLKSINTNYKIAEKDDVEQYILQILGQINCDSMRRNRAENLQTWERGWKENLDAFKISLSGENLKPKYFRQSKFFRFKKGIVLPQNQDIEHDLFTLVRYFLFEKYFKDFDNIYELGCGSCQNLLMLSELFPQKTYVGMDWASSSKKICDLISRKKNIKVSGKIFNMLEPGNEMFIEKNSLVFSIHALEQLGKNHKQLISFLRRMRPALVLNYEPIEEFYDEDNVYDYLALMYTKKRNYLCGFLTMLRDLAKKGKVEIIEAFRPYIGGVFHEASIIAWKPL